MTAGLAYGALVTGVSVRWRPLAVFVTVPVLLLLRLVLGGFDFDSVWAEDGRVFLRDAELHGLGSVGYVYGGYLHLTPRLLALTGGALPLEGYPIFTAAASGLVIGLLAAFVYAVAVRLLGHRDWALLPALGMALVPAANSEALLNIANLQWWWLTAAFVALAVGPIDSPGWLRLTAPVVVLLAGLTTPLALLLAPAAFIRGRRDAGSWQVIALVVALAVQGAAILFGPRSDLAFDRDGGLSAGLAGGFFSGVLGPAREPDVLSAAVGLLVGVGLLALGWAVRRERPMLAMAATTSALMLYAVTTVLSGSNSRYQTGAALLLLVAVADVARRVPKARLAVVAVLGALAVVGFPASSYRTSVAGWAENVEAIRESCEDGAAAGQLTVAPAGWMGSEFTVPCGAIAIP